MKLIVVAMGMMVVFAGSLRADSLYSRLESLYAGAGLPSSADMKGQSALIGKCVSKSQPMVRTNGALFLYVQTGDPVLGPLFDMVPFFHLTDDEMRYENLLEKSRDVIESHYITSSIAMKRDLNAWETRYKDSSRGYEQTVRLKEFRTDNGRPAFILKHLDLDLFCYYYSLVSAAAPLSPVPAPPRE